MYRACKQKERKEATSGSVDDSVTSILLQDSPQTTPELVHVSVLPQHCIQQFLDGVGSRLHDSTSSYSFSASGNKVRVSAELSGRHSARTTCVGLIVALCSNFARAARLAFV